jgi:hypothetical protein
LKEGIGRDQHPFIDIDDFLDFPDDWKEAVGALDFIPGVGYLIIFLEAIFLEMI